MRRITVVVDSRANWSRAATIIEAMDARTDIECRFIACSRFAYDWVGFTVRKPDNVLQTYFPEDIPISMVQSSANLLVALADAFRNNPPDIVVAMTDRYETLAVAQTAALMNIHIAHIQGGEISGTIDNSIRDAVTKLAHIHFPATLEAADRLVGLGERLENIYPVGCPATDLLLQVDISQRQITEPYILVLYHPVTTEYEHSYLQMTTVLDGVKEAWDGLVVAIGPNHDAGNHGVWEAIAESGVKAPHLVPHDVFVNLMAHAEVMVGNSSAGIREACYFGTPVVDVGTRQHHRIPRGSRVWSSTTQDSISKSIEGLLCRGRGEPEHLYGDGMAGVKIAELLATMELPNIQKWS